MCDIVCMYACVCVCVCVCVYVYVYVCMYVYKCIYTHIILILCCFLLFSPEFVRLSHSSINTVNTVNTVNNYIGKQFLDCLPKMSMALTTTVLLIVRRHDI